MTGAAMVGRVASRRGAMSMAEADVGGRPRCNAEVA
jgi:hypothetical protein